MRITGNHAQQVSMYAHEISGGTVYVCSVGGDIGNGARIIDGNTQLVWLGQPRLATAYYLGQVAALRKAHGITGVMPHPLPDLQAELLDDDRRTAVMEWYRRGLTDGADRAGTSREAGK